MNVRMDDQSTPLYFAEHNGHAEGTWVKVVMHSLLNISLCSFSVTAIYIVLLINLCSVCELLLENSAEVDAQAADGSTPLYVAAFNKHRDVCEVLVVGNADVNLCMQDKSTALHVAARTSQPDIVRYFVDQHGQ